MKIKTKLNGATQWSMLKFKTVETLDTAFYECRVSNDMDTIKSVAIITVERAKPGSSGGFINRNSNPFGNDDNLGNAPNIILLKIIPSPTIPDSVNFSYLKLLLIMK